MPTPAVFREGSTFSKASVSGTTGLFPGKKSPIFIGSALKKKRTENSDNSRVTRGQKGKDVQRTVFTLMEKSQSQDKKPELGLYNLVTWGFPGNSVLKDPPANAGDAGSIPGLGDVLKKGMATHSSILA